MYPYEIEDRNGNYILINYVSSVGPKISSIEDTLGRYIHFYYASNGDLVTITAPGLSGGSDLQMMRFYYQDITLSTGIFGSGINVNSDMPSTLHTLQYVYLPSSSDGSGTTYSGYRFDYRSYGTMYQVTQSRGMTVSSTSTSSAGTVTGDGTMAAQTNYNYPSSPSSLTDVPTYTTRTDDWAGRTTSMSGGAPHYTFSVTRNTTTNITTSDITAPDGTISETLAKIDDGQWDDGQVTDTYIKDSSNTYSHTQLDWERDSSNQNPRVSQIRTTDSQAGLTKATVLSYTSYNIVSSVSERDFTTDGSVSSTVLRHTDSTWGSDASRHLLHLQTSVKVYAGSDSTQTSRVDYAYDNYGTSHVNLTARDDIIMHDPAFDPFQHVDHECHWECSDFNQQEGCTAWEWVCTDSTAYDSATDARGNVTSVTTYPDAGTTTGAITHSMTYDIAGNVMTAQVDCCQLKAFTYSGAGTNGAHDYANVIQVTSGNPSGTNISTTAQFDFNTGLLSWSKDANTQQTSYSYNSNSLRTSEVDSPDGGLALFTYSDALSSSHYNVETSTKLDGSGGSIRYVNSFRFFDGRGAIVRTMSLTTSTDGYMTQDIEYDTMGRAYRASNPYYASSSSAAINSDGYWTTSTFDHLGRVTQVTMPRGDNDNSLTTSVSTSFDGVYTTVTDQAGKVRRQKVDALGRVIRLDEPTSSGLGTTSSPNQATNYYYDVLDNLVHINQGSQDRYFKYDSLSRLIRERQVEQTTNSSYDLSDSLTSNSSWSRKIVCNNSGLVTDAYDARGVHTTMSYDDLNRVTQISYSDSTPTAHYYYDSQTLPSGAPSYTHSNSTGRLLAMTYGSGATGDYFAYDAMGRVMTQKQVTGSTTYGLSYSYNYAGELTGETYPSGRALTYSYDDGGRLSSVSDGTTAFANSFSYAAHGGLSSETWGNTAVHAMSYNRRLQASQVKLSMGSTVQQQYDYSYGQFNTSDGSTDTSKNNGQIGKVLGTIGATAQWNQGFSYDELGRLSNIAEHSGSTMTTSTYSQGYSYDRYGNRAQSANSTLSLPGVASTDYSTTTNRFGSSIATYDDAGNIITDSKFRSLKYEYDANGRQTAAKLLDNTSLQGAVYDCAGQRVQTTAGSVTRTMVYDIFGQDVADYTGSSGTTLERENIYRGGQLLASDAGQTGYGYRRAITIDHTKIPNTDQSNFPVLISGTYSYLATTANGGNVQNSNGYDVIFASDSGCSTKLNHETENYSATTGAVNYWVKVPTVSHTTDTTIYMCYGNTSVTTDQSNATGVWDSNYKGVWHLGNGSTLSTADSTNQLNGTNHSATAATGKIGGGAGFNGSSQSIGVGTSGLTSGITLESWVYRTGANGFDVYADFGLNSTDGFCAMIGGPSVTHGFVKHAVQYVDGAVASAANTWEHIVWTVDSDKKARLFINGALVTTTTDTQSLVASTHGGSLGSRLDSSGNPSQFFTGNLDEVRLSSTVRSADWIATEYNNESSPSTFYNVASAVSAVGGIQYVLSDVQGSARTVMNNNGSASAVIARHDFLPFGEEINSGIGLRTSGQGYGGTDYNRQKYGLTERDDVTGLDHTWFRKYENFSGRWTGADPYNVSSQIIDPQSFNAYPYVENDPTNFTDPVGLYPYPLSYPDSLFDDYMIPVWRNGWNQMYGLNPISFGPFETSYASKGGERWWRLDEYTTITLGGYDNPCDDQEAVGREINYIARKVGGRANLEKLTITGLGNATTGQVVQRFRSAGFQLFFSFNPAHPGDNLEWQWMNGQYGDTHFYHVTVEPSKYKTQTVMVPKMRGDTSTPVEVKVPDPDSLPSRITIHCDSAENHTLHHLWYDYFRMTWP